MVSEKQLSHVADALLIAHRDAERLAEIVHPLIREAQAARKHLLAVAEQLQPALTAYGADVKMAQKICKSLEPDIYRIARMLSTIDDLQQNILPLWKTKSHLPEDAILPEAIKPPHINHDCMEVDAEISRLYQELEFEQKKATKYKAQNLRLLERMAEIFRKLDIDAPWLTIPYPPDGHASWEDFDISLDSSEPS